MACSCTRCCGSTNMLLSAAFFAFLVVAPCYASIEKASYVKPPPCQRMVVYKRRHYYVPGPSTMPNKRKVISPTGNVYRKRIAYTELKDMNND